MAIRRKAKDDNFLPKKKKPKIKGCPDCRNFPFKQNKQLQKDYYCPAPNAKGTLAFILSPMDFNNLKVNNWMYIMQSYLSDFNLLFIPFPYCYAHAFDAKKTSITILRICKHKIIDTCIDLFNVDLLVVFPETKDLLSIDNPTKKGTIDWPGNWGEYNGLRTYYAKKLYSITTKGICGAHVEHTANKIKKYFNKELIWQQSPDFRRVLTLEDLENTKKLIADLPLVTIDVETSGLDVLAPDFRLKTVSISWLTTTVCIGYDVEECVDIKYKEAVKTFFIELSSRKTICKTAHNLKYEMSVFYVVFGMRDFTNWEDTMFLSNLFDENKQSNSLKFLAGEYCDGYDKLVDDFESATYEELFFYNCLDGVFTYQLKEGPLNWSKQPPELAERLKYAYHKCMLPLCYELCLIEMHGVQINYDYINEFNAKTAKQLQEIDADIKDKFPVTIGANLGSPKQLADILFNKLKYPIIKKTKTGISTDYETLLTLAESHNCDLATLLVTRKKLAKMRSTYVTPYIEKRSEYRNDMVRTNYGQTRNESAQSGEAKGTRTGRLCVHGDTILNTNKGSFKIKDLDLIKYPNCTILTHKGRQRKIIAKYYKGREKMFRVVLDHTKSILCTVGHKFLTPDGWKHLRDLRYKSRIYTYTNNNLYPTTIEAIIPKNTCDVWDIEVEEDHSYLAQGFVNHNSSARPNLQNIPRDPTVKRIFRPKKTKNDSRVMLQADLSQAELRIGASLAFEQRMLDIYENAGDIHWETGKASSKPEDLAALETMDPEKKKKEIKYIRTKAKAINFGLLYGGGPGVLQSVAKLGYGIDMSEAEATEAREAFFRTYPNLTVWHEAVKNFVKNHGYSISPFGRIRHLPNVFNYPEHAEEFHKCLRQGINAPVQNSCADFLSQVWAMSGEDIRKYKLDAPACLTVHDSIVFDCLNEDTAYHVIQIINKTTAYWTDFHRQTWLRCPMVMDYELGPTWGDLEELDTNSCLTEDRKKAYASLTAGFMPTEVANNIERRSNIVV